MNHYNKISFFNKTGLIVFVFFIMLATTVFIFPFARKAEAQTLTTYVLLGTGAADNDGGCPNIPGYGGAAAAYFNQSPGVFIGGYGSRQTFDCAAISLASDGTYAPNIDIRFGVTVSDQPCTPGTGSIAWTPWASQGGGQSPFAYEPGNNDPDCIGIRIETISRPGFILGPLRAGIRVATAQPNCNIDGGAAQYTTWSPTPSIQTSPWALKASASKLAPCVSILLNMAPPIAPTYGAQYVPPTDIPSSYLPNETKTGNYHITMRNTGSGAWLSDQRARISSSGTCQTAVGGSSVNNAPNLGNSVGTSCTTQYWFSSTQSYLGHTNTPTSFSTPPVWRYQRNASETISVDEEWTGSYTGACEFIDDDSYDCNGNSKQIWNPDAGSPIYNNIYAYSYNRSPNIVQNDTADFYGTNCGAGCFVPFNITAPATSNNETWTKFLNGSNIGNALIPLTVTPAAGPDLTAGAPPQTTATIGTPQSFTSVITNGGSVTTGASFSNSLQVSTGPCASLPTCPTAVSPLIAGTPSPMPALAAGALQTASASYTFTGAAGTRSVRFCADNNTSMVGTIAESNETNNCSGWTDLTVGAAPVPATADISATPAGSIPYDTSSTLNWSYSNATSCTITSPATIGGYPNGSGSISTGNLQIGRTYTISCDPGGVNDSVTVNVLAQTFSLNVIKSGQGLVSGTPNPAQTNVNCGGTCNATYTTGTTIDLTATPNTGRIFTGWGGDCSSFGRNPVCSVTVNSPKSVIANFIADPDYGEF